MPRVTLTFDNGPEPGVTPLVLDILARHGVKATFFVMGEKAARPEGVALIRRAVADGHWIGNHTFHHRVLGRLDDAAAVREIELAAEALSFLDPPVRLFRPVGGGVLGPHLLRPAAVDKLKADGYTCVLWNSVPGDFKDPHGWLTRALEDCRTRDWTLIVLHDKPNGAMDHLDEFLTRLRAENFELPQPFPPDCILFTGAEHAQ